MKKWIAFAGIGGLVLLLFGVIGGFVVEFRGIAMLLPGLHLAAGALLVALWFIGAGIGNIKSALFGRSTQYGAVAVLSSVLFIGIAIAANWIASQHNSQWDLTEEGVYSISDQSKQVIKSLTSPLKVVVFKTANGPDPQRIKDLLNLYSSQNPSKFSYDIIDPQAKPQLVEKFQMKTGNFIYMEYGEADPKNVTRLGDFTEEAITNAVLKLARGEAKKIYYVQGHGEADLKFAKEGGAKQFADEANNSHLKVEGVFLAQVNKIPDDAAAVILNSPRKPMLQQEKDMLIRYVDNGGRLLMFSDPQRSTDTKELASYFGITIGDNVVIDPMQQIFGSPVQPVVSDFDKRHPITAKFSEGAANMVAVFNVASSVTVDKTKKDSKWNCTDLLKSGADSWGETDLQSLFNPENPKAEKGPEDLAGPLALGVACEKKLDAPEAEKKDGKENFEKVARVVVYGDSDWIANGNLGVSANKDLAMNSLSWLAGEEGGISIRPKQMRFSMVPISKEQYIDIFILSYIVPEILLLAGLWVWWRRRSKRSRGISD